MMHVERDDPMREDVRRLVAEHLTEMFAFAPSRRWYRRHGVTDREPFADYSLDPNSVDMSPRLSDVPAR